MKKVIYTLVLAFVVSTVGFILAELYCNDMSSYFFSAVCSISGIFIGAVLGYYHKNKEKQLVASKTLLNAAAVFIVNIALSVIAVLVFDNIWINIVIPLNIIGIGICMKLLHSGLKQK